MVATIGIIPLEFVDQDGNSWYLEGDIMVEEAKCTTLVPKEPEDIKFKKWMKAGHLTPLYIKAHINGKPLRKVLIDGEAMLNTMPYSMGKSRKDLKETNMIMSNFTRGSISASGFLIVELTMRSRTTNTMFFVVDAKLGYTILLGKEWIHTN